MNFECRYCKTVVGELGVSWVIEGTLHWPTCGCQRRKGQPIPEDQVRESVSDPSDSQDSK